MPQVISDILKENKAITKLVLDQNPIGERGGRAVLRAIRTFTLFGMQRDISIKDCNIQFNDNDTSNDNDPQLLGEPRAFDPLVPAGQYKLNLAKPFDRMIAWELVELAWWQDGENWQHETCVYSTRILG